MSSAATLALMVGRRSLLSSPVLMACRSTKAAPAVVKKKAGNPYLTDSTEDLASNVEEDLIKKILKLTMTKRTNRLTQEEMEKFSKIHHRYEIEMKKQDAARKKIAERIYAGKKKAFKNLPKPLQDAAFVLDTTPVGYFNMTAWSDIKLPKTLLEALEKDEKDLM
eukprot:TRINITY_DN11389_c0_g1_i1.p1 TRINITY_DN11389_c0_g1~~TRINITY_DN11389_c0_g1_i1.p1  ORF type:complete len:165 (-),score=72.02 TRINITY_DN11389_c0_g1_i1:126-620(-)